MSDTDRPDPAEFTEVIFEEGPAPPLCSSRWHTLSAEGKAGTACSECGEENPFPYDAKLPEPPKEKQPHPFGGKSAYVGGQQGAAAAHSRPQARARLAEAVQVPMENREIVTLSINGVEAMEGLVANMNHDHLRRITSFTLTNAELEARFKLEEPANLPPEKDASLNTAAMQREGEEYEEKLCEKMRHIQDQNISLVESAARALEVGSKPIYIHMTPLTEEEQVDFTEALRINAELNGKLDAISWLTKALSVALVLSLSLLAWRTFL